MIRNDNEYKQAVKQRDAQAERLKAQRQSLVASGFSPTEVERGMAPVESFHQPLVEEIELYEELKRSGLSAVSKLGSFGQQLVGLRIATGLTQRELAERLDSLRARPELSAPSWSTMAQAAEPLQPT